MPRRLLFLVRRVDAASVPRAEDEVHDAGVRSPRGFVVWGQKLFILCPSVRAMVEEELHGALVTAGGGEVQRSASVARARVDVGAARYEQARERVVSAPHGEVKRGETARVRPPVDARARG